MTLRQFLHQKKVVKKTRLMTTAVDKKEPVMGAHRARRSGREVRFENGNVTP